MTPEISSYERLLEVEARQRQDPFWGRVHRQLDEIEAAAPTTSAEVLRLLDSNNPNSGFFHGGMDRELLGSLTIAGWEVTEYNASYYWTAQHPATGESLEYIEGDVYNRTDR